MTAIDDLTQLGQWARDNIKAACFNNDINKDDATILMQSLMECSILYPSKNINNLSKIKFHKWLNADGKLNPQIDSPNRKKNTGQERFFVHVGHHDLHARFWKKKKETTNDFITNALKKNNKKLPIPVEDFEEAIVHHYKSSFTNDDEAEFIKKALLQNTNNVHAIVYYTYRQSNAATNCKSNIYIIAAAATIKMSKLSAVLLYLSVSSSEYHQKEDIALPNNQTTKTRFQYQNLGCFLLSMCQFIVYCNVKSTTLLTQVSNSMINGAVYFYLNNYFKIIDKCHYLINEQKNMNGNTIFYETNELVYMMSSVPLYKVYFFDYNNKPATPEILRNALSQGLPLFLKKDEFNENNLVLSFAMDEVFNCIFRTNDEMKKGRSMTLSGSVFKENILQLADNTLLNLKQNDDSFNKDVLYFGSDMIIRFIRNRKNEIKNFTNELDHNTSINFYKIFAYVIFKDVSHEYDIRLFITYILRCLITLNGGVGNESIFNINEQNNKSIQQFQKDLIDTIDNHMSKFLNKHAGHSKIDEIILKTKLQDKFGKQNAHNNGLKSLIRCNLIPDYDMGPLEINLLASICNIDVKLIVFIYHVNKNGIGICKIAQNLQKFIPITPTIYNFLPKLNEVNVKICVVVDNNKKMHFLINEKLKI